MKKMIFTTIVAAFLVIAAAPAFALDLNQARSKGLLGEKQDGYVGVVVASREAQELANDVNARRRDEYNRISQQNSQPASVVAKLAAEQIINNLPAGALYQGANGSWVKK